MKIKHTSGPWILNDEKDQILKVNQHGVEFIVANLEQCINPVNDSLLISTAPEMFEALELLLEGLGKSRISGYDLSKWPKTLQDARIKAHLTLKKARGE